MQYLPPSPWQGAFTPPPPDPPELPSGQDPRPPWPWWYGPVALTAAVFIVFVVGGVVFAIAVGSGSIDDAPAGLTIGLTLFQDIVLVATAVGLAALVSRPRPWQFGLRPTPLWRAVGWAALAAVSYLVFAGIYSALVTPEEQTTLEDLGVDKVPSVVIAFSVVVVAPFVEEVFFRGFLYRALRSSLPVIPAALLGGLIFGLVHLPSGPESVPVLAWFGLVLCLLYEKTGSIYPTIFLHSLLNTLAFGSAADWTAALALGLPTMAACLVLPRLTPGRAPALARA
jgi:membrane protease YdiL (CAAX protease family)